MSEFIIPEKEVKLEEIVKALAAGGTVEDAKKTFESEVVSLSNLEMTKVAQRLDEEGYNFYTEPILKEFIFDFVESKITAESMSGFTSGHPIHSFLLENDLLRQISYQIRQEFLVEQPNYERIEKMWTQIQKVDIHYQRKENQLFPYLEKHGFSHPSTVMWAYQDDIRAELKTIKTRLENGDLEGLAVEAEGALNLVEDLAAREEKMLFPKAESLLSDDEWQEIREGEEEIGYCLIATPDIWEAAPCAVCQETKTPDNEDHYIHPADMEEQAETLPFTTEGCVRLDEGFMTDEQISLLFKFLPFDVTYVDENDRVRFYNKGKGRVFPRSPGIIGREVKFCHPPKSVDTVVKIVDAFRSGAKDSAEFWIEFREQFIHIQYFAVRDQNDKFRGVLEVTQDATHVRSLTGQQRLLDWE